MLVTIYHIVGYDIWFYISHVLLHSRSFYFIHKIHHVVKYKDLRFWNTMDGHIIETPLQTIGIFVPLLFYKPSIELLYAFFVVLMRGYMRHDNRCSWLIGNHHLLHHKHGNYNFGEYWLDRLFGTCYPNKKEYVYGLLYV